MPTAKPIGFLVDDIRGPLVEQELERAVAWGRQLAAQLVDGAEANAGIRTTDRG